MEVPYKLCHPLAGTGAAAQVLRVDFQPAGHILGLVYLEVDVAATASAPAQRVVFSGDLGARYTPLLPTLQPPIQTDVGVQEST